MKTSPRHPVPRHPSGPTRRAVLQGGAALLAAVGFGPMGCALGPDRRFRDDPFTLGVASGDPLPDRVVIWTRLAPRPLAHDGGMSDARVPVRWEVADDEHFTRPVRTGSVIAGAGNAHAVHVDVAGLGPARTYYYRFIAGDAVSATGRTRTAPAPGAHPDSVRLLSLGCQNYEHGFYTAFAHAAEEDVDLVIHTGDYIYEGPHRTSRYTVRRHPGYTCRTLGEYRQRYALYKSDPDLRAVHAAHPFAPVFDDHEVANNWAGDSDAHGHGGAEFAARRAVAFQAWYEHMPLRAAQRPADSHIRIYRRLDYGALVRIAFLDTRQYRTRQPCGGGKVPRCGGDADPHAAMLGDRQERWLRDTLLGSTTRWNVMAQQVLMAELDRDADPDVRRYAMDKWDGYQVPRRRLLSFLRAARIANPVVLSGDIHRHIAAELRPDFSRPETPAVAPEFVNTSISSGGDGKRGGHIERDWPAQNPDIAFAANQRGYCRHVVTEKGWRTDFRVLDRVTVAGAPVQTRAAYVVEPGRARLLSA